MDTALAGAAAGFLAGEFVSLMRRRESAAGSPRFLPACGLAAGLYSGWQGLGLVLWVHAALLVVAGRVRLPRWFRVIPATGWMAVAVMVVLSCWRWIHPFPERGWASAAVYALLLASGTLALAAAVRRFDRA
jgi:hypothetical protein